MPDYRRYFVPGGTYFFTLVVAGRVPLFGNHDARTLLGEMMRRQREAAPFATIHFNPVKHGHVGRLGDWRWSSFHRYVLSGDYPENWGSNAELPPDFGPIRKELLE